VVTFGHERIVADQIEQAYRGIMNLEFSQGCNDKWCKWCNFIREWFVEVEEEAEAWARPDLSPRERGVSLRHVGTIWLS
jgi:hypothetical protein